MPSYYLSEDLARFGDISKTNPQLFDLFLKWYSATMEPGALDDLAIERELDVLGARIEPRSALADHERNLVAIRQRVHIPVLGEHCALAVGHAVLAEVAGAKIGRYGLE